MSNVITTDVDIETTAWQIYDRNQKPTSLDSAAGQRQLTSRTAAV